MINARIFCQIFCLYFLIASAGSAGLPEDEKRDILLTDLPSDVLRLLGQYLGSAEDHYNYCQAVPKVFSGDLAQDQLLRDRKKLQPRHHVQTETGAVFSRIYNHPKLGKAWRVHENIFWGDTVFNQNKLLLATFKEAYDYCMELNGIDRKSVETSYQEREKALEPLRVQLHNAPDQSDPELEGKLRQESERLAPSSGCYPPNREEIESLGIDTNRTIYLGQWKKWEPNSEIMPPWVEFRRIWSGSTTPSSKWHAGGAYSLSGESGYVLTEVVYTKKPVRCMCRAKTADMHVQEKNPKSSWMDWFKIPSWME